MNMDPVDQSEGKPLPARWVAGLILLGLAPSLARAALALAPGAFTTADPSALPVAGGLVILRVLACTMAIVASMLCFAHFARTGDITTPILGMGLLASGLADLWQTMVAAGMVPITTGTALFLPFAWTLSRTLFGLVLLVAASVFLVFERVRGTRGRARSLGHVALGGLLFAAAGCGIVIFSAYIPGFAERFYGGRAAQIFWNASPFIILLFVSTYLLPTYYHWHRSVYTQSLMLGCLPLALSQVHFLLDPAAAVTGTDPTAALLVLVGTFIPLIGLVVDYQYTYIRIEEANTSLREELLLLQQSSSAQQQDRTLVNLMMDAAADPICVLDTSLHITRANNAFSRLTGLKSPAYALGKSPEALFGEATASMFRRAGQLALDQRTPTTCLIHREEDHILYRITPARDNAGQILALLYIGQLQRDMSLAGQTG